jgi:hypothetical protein
MSICSLYCAIITRAIIILSFYRANKTAAI